MMENEKRFELGFPAVTFYFIMIMELNFARRQEQTVAVSFKTV